MRNVTDKTSKIQMRDFVFLSRSDTVPPNHNGSVCGKIPKIFGPPKNNAHNMYHKDPKSSEKATTSVLQRGLAHAPITEIHARSNPRKPLERRRGYKNERKTYNKKGSWKDHRFKKIGTSNWDGGHSKRTLQEQIRIFPTVGTRETTQDSTEVEKSQRREERITRRGKEGGWKERGEDERERESRRERSLCWLELWELYFAVFNATGDH